MEPEDWEESLRTFDGREKLLKWAHEYLRSKDSHSQMPSRTGEKIRALLLLVQEAPSHKRSYNLVANEIHRLMAPGLPPVVIHHPHIELRNNGQPFIKDSNIPVRRLWAWHRAGVLFSTLQSRYPQISPGKLLDALSFAYDNLLLVEADLARERREDKDP